MGKKGDWLPGAIVIEMFVWINPCNSSPVLQEKKGGGYDIFSVSGTRVGKNSGADASLSYRDRRGGGKREEKNLKIFRNAGKGLFSSLPYPFPIL